MSEARPSGCGFLLAILVTMLTVFGISQPEVKDALRSLVPQQVPVTYAPEAQMPFTLQNDQIIYSWRYSLNEPYSLFIQGRIHDANGKPVTNVLMNIGAVSVEGVAPDSPIHFHPKDFP